MPDAQATLDRRAAALGEAVKRLGPWKQVSADVGRTLWKAGPYTLVGDSAGRNANQSIRRTWTLKYGTTVIGRPARLSEGKRDAVEHYADRVTLPEMDAQTGSDEVTVSTSEAERGKGRGVNMIPLVLTSDSYPVVAWLPQTEDGAEGLAVLQRTDAECADAPYVVVTARLSEGRWKAFDGEYDITSLQEAMQFVIGTWKWR